MAWPWVWWALWVGFSKLLGLKEGWEAFLNLIPPVFFNALVAIYYA